MGGFYIGYKKFLVCFKPRGDMNDEFMSLCIEMNNMASRAASGTNRKKYMFSAHAGVSFCKNKQCFIPFFFTFFVATHTNHFVVSFKQMLLKQDPTTFQPAKLILELERAVKTFKANKYDLVSFPRAYFCFTPQILSKYDPMMQHFYRNICSNYQ